MSEINWQGTTFSWNSISVGNVVDMSSSFSDAVADIDITDVDDTGFANARPGRMKAGFFEFTFNFNPDDTGWSAMEADRATNTSRVCVLVAPSGTLDTRTFTAKIVGMDGPISGGDDSIYTGKAKLKLLSAIPTES